MKNFVKALVISGSIAALANIAAAYAGTGAQSEPTSCPAGQTSVSVADSAKKDDPAAAASDEKSGSTASEARKPAAPAHP